MRRVGGVCKPTNVLAVLRSLTPSSPAARQGDDRQAMVAGTTSAARAAPSALRRINSAPRICEGNVLPAGKSE